jgi:ABC-type sugar transport system ATPase subunit
VAREVESMAMRLGVGALLGRMPESISGGERQRVALGRALIRRPAVLLLDEPLTGVDAPLRRQLLAEVFALHREVGCTTLYITHDQREALALGCRVAVMAEGRVLEVGTAELLRACPATGFTASFLQESTRQGSEGGAGFDGGGRLG